MSASWKGTIQVVLISEEAALDAETGVRWVDRVWAGRKDAIYGWAEDLKEAGISYQISSQPPVYLISARVPLNDPAVEVLDRYEITTEAQDRSIFEVPAVIADAAAFDASISAAAETYRQRAENAVNNKDEGPTSLFQQVVRHLKDGVTGYQIDFLVLRRFRQIEQAYAYGAGKMSLSDGLLIYSTAQLNLPSNVAFTLPDTPADPSVDYSWGWRVRGQRVELQGNYAEQVIELVFAPWSTLEYTNAGGNLSW